MPSLVPAADPGGWAGRQPQPRFDSDGLTLRPWESSDVPVLLQAYSDPAIQQWHARSMTSDEAEQWVVSRVERWAAETGVDWAVVRDDAVLGRVGLRRMSLAEGDGEVAYWVLPAARGEGVAPRAVRAMTDWLFSYTGLHRLELAHSALNAASCRVARKSGYRYEGTKRQQALHPDGWHDMHLHSRLRDDTE
jgi:RimJ/RimL family protein N-acetyltransferase